MLTIFNHNPVGDVDYTISISGHSGILKGVFRKQTKQTAVPPGWLHLFIKTKPPKALGDIDV